MYLHARVFFLQLSPLLYQSLKWMVDLPSIQHARKHFSWSSVIVIVIFQKGNYACATLFKAFFVPYLYHIFLFKEVLEWPLSCIFDCMDHSPIWIAYLRKRSIKESCHHEGRWLFCQIVSIAPFGYFMTGSSWNLLLMLLLVHVWLLCLVNLFCSIFNLCHVQWLSTHDAQYLLSKTSLFPSGYSEIRSLLEIF